MDVLPDLVLLLKEQNQEVRYEASRLLSPFATQPAGRKKLVELDAITVLIRLLGDITPIAHQGLVTLINLSEEPEAVTVMLKKGLISTLIDCAVEDNNKYIALHASLLSNLTLHKEGCEQMEKIGFRAVKLLHCLLSTYTRDPEKNHPIGLALVKCIRTTALEPSLRTPLIQLFTLQIDLTPEKTPIRRTIYKIMRNICFGQRSHKTLLSDLAILPLLLSPLRGTEDLTEDEKVGMSPSLDKNRHAPRPREPNTACQMLLIDALHQLTATRFGRATLRDGKAYPILREFDKSVPEEEEEKKEAIFQVIEPLISDEGDVVDEYDDPPKGDTTNEATKGDDTKGDSSSTSHMDKKSKMEDEIEEI